MGATTGGERGRPSPKNISWRDGASNIPQSLTLIPKGGGGHWPGRGVARGRGRGQSPPGASPGGRQLGGHSLLITLLFLTVPFCGMIGPLDWRGPIGYWSPPSEGREIYVPPEGETIIVPPEGGHQFLVDLRGDQKFFFVHCARKQFFVPPKHLLQVAPLSMTLR